MIISTKYLITGDGKTVLTDKAVYVGEDGKIGKIAPKEELLKEFPQEEVKEYGDATLLPGLMDMHAHLAYGYSQPDSFNYGPQLIMLYALQHAQSAFERGITTVRDMSSAHGVCKNLKLAEKKGFVVIPRIVHTDTGICMTGGHAWEEVEEMDGPWAIRKEIRKQVRDGAEWVKILTTNREPYPEFTQEELDAVAVHKSDMITYVTEWVNGVVFGETPLDDASIAEFQETMKTTMHIDDILATYNAAYERFQDRSLNQ